MPPPSVHAPSSKSAFGRVGDRLVGFERCLARGAELCSVLSVQSFRVRLLRALDRLRRSHLCRLHRGGRFGGGSWRACLRRGAIVRRHRAAAGNKKCGCRQGRQISESTHGILPLLWFVEAWGGRRFRAPLQLMGRLLPRFQRCGGYKSVKHRPSDLSETD